MHPSHSRTARQSGSSVFMSAVSFSNASCGLGSRGEGLGFDVCPASTPHLKESAWILDQLEEGWQAGALECGV